MADGRTISDADRARARRMTTNESDMDDTLYCGEGSPFFANTPEGKKQAEKYADEQAGKVILMKDGYAVVPERNMGGMMQDMPGYMGGGMMQDMPGYMGGGMMDETLGYTRGGMTEEKRGPIKYSKGCAIKGRDFKGSF